MPDGGPMREFAKGRIATDELFLEEEEEMDDDDDCDDDDDDEAMA